MDSEENKELDGSGRRVSCGGQELPAICILWLAEIPEAGVAVCTESQGGCLGEEFTDIEEALSNTFLPSLFGDEYNKDNTRRKLACLPVKHARMTIPDPTTSAQSYFEASILIYSHLLAALQEVKVF